MLFDTPIYLFFLLLVVTLYWQFNWRKQNVLLLVASYFFYGWWDWRFLGLIIVSTIVDFYCAKVVARSNNPAQRKSLLLLSVSLNLGFLGFFKYFNFFAESLHVALAAAGIDVSPQLLRIVLPPGISFYTFQALAYIVDVYFKRLEPAENLVDYALFISLFPHLIAGPIQRPGHLLPQTQNPRTFRPEAVFSGLQLICYGLFRKCVVADSCGLLANAAFQGHMGSPNLVVLMIGAYAFAWQIYGDFAGYSDIARGSAQLLGFHFIVNFRQPYLSRSLQEFWRRWHISLSTWLRDYLYISLGGNRGGEGRTHLNLLLTMMIGGLWHGANWTFVLWGAIHGLGLSVERWLGTIGLVGRTSRPEEEKNTLTSPMAWVKRIFIFHLVCFAWIFFRAASIRDAISLLRGATVWVWRPEYATAFLFLAFFTIPMFLMDLVMEQTKEEYLFENTSWRFRIIAAAGVCVAILAFTANQANAFIYFQF